MKTLGAKYVSLFINELELGFYHSHFWHLL